MNFFYVILGAVSLGLGIMGIFLPILPTTPFLLLTAWLWMKGSPRLHDKLLAHKRLGPYIIAFQRDRALPMRVKIVSTAMLWATILSTAFLAIDRWWLRTLLLAVAAAVTAHILSFKTLRK